MELLRLFIVLVIAAPFILYASPVIIYAVPFILLGLGLGIFAEVVRRHERARLSGK